MLGQIGLYIMILSCLYKRHGRFVPHLLYERFDHWIWRIILVPLKNCSVLSSKLCQIFGGRVKRVFITIFKNQHFWNRFYKNKICQKCHFKQLWSPWSTSYGAPCSAQKLPNLNKLWQSAEDIWCIFSNYGGSWTENGAPYEFDHGDRSWLKSHFWQILFRWKLYNQFQKCRFF